MKIHRSTLFAPLFGPLLSVFISAVLISPVVHAQDAAAAPAGDKPAGFAPESIEKGRKMYRQFCLRCHGPEMVGGNNAFDLRTFPVEQPERFVNSVLNGKRAMPPWKGIITEEEISHIWSYVGSRGGKS